MVKRGTYTSPPSITTGYYTSINGDKIGLRARYKTAPGIYPPRNLETTRRAFKIRRGKIAMGSRRHLHHVRRTPRELRMVRKAGMTPEQALQTATPTLATLLGTRKELGSQLKVTSPISIAVDSIRADIRGPQQRGKWV